MEESLDKIMMEMREIYAKQINHPLLRSALRASTLSPEDWSRIDEFMNYSKTFKEEWTVKELFNMFVSLARLSRKAYTDVSYRLKKLLESDDKYKLMKAGYGSEQDVVLHQILVENFPRNVQRFSKLLLIFYDELIEKDLAESISGKLVGLEIPDLDQNYHALEVMVAKLEYADTSLEG